MARTPVGTTLTEQHRQRQLQVRARTLREFAALWPVWTGDPRSFELLVSASVPLVQSRRRISAGVASDYFQAFRVAEQADGSATARIADPVENQRVVSSLYVTGQTQVSRSVRAGMSFQAAKQQTLVTMSGAVARHVLDGGRQTVLQSVASDRETVGWQRVTDGRPCAFCALLAARGAAYSEDTAGFQAHDHCACTAEPRYAGTEMPALSRRFRQMYDEAQRTGNASGTTNDALNNFRRLYEDSLTPAA